MNLVNAFIGVMVVVIIAIGVAIPIIQDVIGNSTLTGQSATLLAYVPLLLVVVIVVAVVAMIR